MKKLRLLLLPFGAVAELVILATCWVVAPFSADRAERIMLWATDHLPSLDWYTREAK